MYKDNIGTIKNSLASVDALGSQLDFDLSRSAIVALGFSNSA